MKKGFTLPELLIVMGLVAVMMTTISVLSVQGNLKRSKDHRRKSDLESVRTALELYKSNNPARKYPVAPNWTALDTALNSYLPDMPTDPNYTYTGTDFTYLLCADMEIPANENGLCGDGTYGVTQP